MGRADRSPPIPGVAGEHVQVKSLLPPSPLACHGQATGTYFGKFAYHLRIPRHLAGRDPKNPPSACIRLEISLSTGAGLPLDYTVMDSPLTRPELPAISFLEGMADEDRALLSNYGEFLPVHPQQTLITEGAAQDSLYLLISGLLHVSREKDGSRTLLWRVTPGETIGEVNLFDPAEASADVTAQEFSQVWRANRGDLETFVNAYPEAGAFLMAGLARLLSKRLRAMNARFATLQEAIATTPQAWH